MNSNLWPEFRSLLAKEGLAEHTDKLLAATKTGIHLAKQFTTVEVEQKAGFFGLLKHKPKSKRQGLPASVGTSRIGGLPDVPPGFVWPVWEGKPLGFLAQINCAQMREFCEHTQLPPTGILHFFYDWQDFPDFMLPGTPYVYYTADAAGLQPAKAPDTRPASEILLPPFPVSGVAIPTLPPADSPEFDALQIPEADSEKLFDLMDEFEKKYAVAGARHQLGGLPRCIQGDVRAEFEMYSQGNFASTDRQRWEAAGKSADAWRLLLQFDTDDDLDFMWGDAGTIYFGLREEDLRAGRFDKAGAIGQCY